MSTTGSNARDVSADDLAAQLDAVRNDVRLLAEMAGSRARGEAEGVRDEAHRRTEALSEDARRLYEEARHGLSDTGTRARGEAEEAIRRNPFASVGLALAAGWLIGTVLRR